MKRPAKDGRIGRDAYVDRLVQSVDNLKSAVETFNDKMRVAFEELVKPAMEAHNELLAEVEGWRADIVGEMETYRDEHSDEWRESEAGSNYDEWINQWEYAALTVIDLCEPEELHEEDSWTEEIYALRDLAMEVDL